MEQTKLDNGLRLVSHFMPDRNSAFSIFVGLIIGWIIFRSVNSFSILSRSDSAFFKSERALESLFFNTLKSPQNKSLRKRHIDKDKYVDAYKRYSLLF